jgi:glycosyltransferase involved in cell wall biosynthesis
MFDLIINGTATTHSSRGARRYFDGIMAHLNWPGHIHINPTAKNPRLVRLNEVTALGRKDAVYWSPAHRGPLFAANHVVTVLDCINMEYVYANSWKLPILRAVFGQLISNAVAVVAISATTKAAILRNFDIKAEKIHVFAGPTDLIVDTAAERPGATDENFVLMITNTLPHKNTGAAGRAFAASSAAKRGIELRIVGAMDAAGHAACANAGVRVTEHHGVADTVLDIWLRQADFLLSPSLDEGLNLPIAEAIGRGTNVLCSDIPVHREFYADCVAFFDPKSEAAITLALDAAFERKGRWFTPQPRPEFSVAGIAARYRELFLSLYYTKSHGS